MLLLSPNAPRPIGIKNITSPQPYHVYQLGRLRNSHRTTFLWTQAVVHQARDQLLWSWTSGISSAEIRATRSALAASCQKALATLSNARKQAWISLSPWLSRSSKLTSQLSKRLLHSWLPFLNVSVNGENSATEHCRNFMASTNRVPSMQLYKNRTASIGINCCRVGLLLNCLTPNNDLSIPYRNRIPDADGLSH